MRSPKEWLSSEAEPSPSLLQVFDALILSDGPILDQRFQEAIAMHPDPAVRKALKALPTRVSEGSRITRRAGVEWERLTGSSALDDEFKRRAERFLLEALLDSAEAQIRLKAFMSRHAPNKETRDLIDSAIDIHRELTQALRHALDRIGDVPDEPTRREGVPYVGPDDASGDLRGQVEDAIRHMSAKGQKPRMLVASSNAVRHLRDQGLFRDQQTTVLGVPVQVEFSWPGVRFALLSYDSASLDEITRSEK